MIELVCRQGHRTKRGWFQYSAVIPPSAVEEWCKRFHKSDAVNAIWRLATELVEATRGLRHWVCHDGNAMVVTWEMKRLPDEREIVIPAPTGSVDVRLIVDR